MMHTQDEDSEREGRYHFEEASQWKPAHTYRLHGFVRSGEQRNCPDSLRAFDSRVESEDGKETFSRPVKWLK